MDLFEWSLLGFVAWFLIGFLNARIVNDSPFGHILACGEGWCNHSENSFRWARPIRTSSGQKWFGLAVITGPFGVLVTSLVVVWFFLFEIVYERIADKLGNLLAPK